MWRLIKAEFDYRKWQLVWMLGIVIVPLTIIVAFVTRDFELQEIRIPLFIFLIYLPTVMVAFGFEHTESTEKRLRLLGILPVARREIGFYRLGFILIIHIMVGIYYLLLNHFITINGVKLSLVFILSLIAFVAFFGLSQMFFYEFKRLPPVLQWIYRIVITTITTGWLLYLFFHGTVWKLFSSSWLLVIFLAQAIAVYLVTQALFIRRKTLYK